MWLNMVIDYPQIKAQSSENCHRYYLFSKLFRYVYLKIGNDFYN